MATNDERHPYSRRKPSEYLRSIKNRNYSLLFVSLFLILLILNFVRVYVSGESVLDTLYEDMLGNAIGSLLSILIFDLFYNKLSRDSDLDSIYENIRNTILLDPEILDGISPVRREGYLSSLADSFSEDEDIRDMLKNRMKGYLYDVAYRAVRTRFIYDIELTDRMPDIADMVADTDAYYYIQEKLFYSVKYLTNVVNRELDGTFFIAFPFGSMALDQAFRREETQEEMDHIIFRESLELEAEDRDRLIAKFVDGPEHVENRKASFLEATCLDVRVDGIRAELQDASLAKEKSGEMALIAKFNVTGFDQGKAQHDVRILFHIPRLKNRPFEVVLSQPTKAPRISLSYEQTAMQVEVMPYLTWSSDTAVVNMLERNNGICEVSIDNDWIYPVSGMVFEIKNL